MPMPQYNGPTYGYNPYYNTYLPPFRRSWPIAAARTARPSQA